MTHQAVILVGGKGTRLRPLTNNTPKPLLLVNGRPFVQHLIEYVRSSGFENIVLLVGPYRTHFEDALGTGARLGVTLTYFSEPEQSGTGTAIVRARRCLEKEFLLLNGDTLFEFDICDFIKRPMTGSCLARIALTKLDEGARYGMVRLSGDYVLNFCEKAIGRGGIINAGAYWVDRDIVKEIIDPPCSLEKDIFPTLSKRRLIRGFVYSGKFIDIGVPEDLLRAQKVLG
ncbi:MAG TPA: hypothetical protein EYO53_11135 [Alphaproteobacteria bacterium]|nr:hypothetical protein [Alphaproteobacteria bacterium]